jgi:hypothetical protein
MFMRVLGTTRPSTLQRRDPPKSLTNEIGHCSWAAAARVSKLDLASCRESLQIEVFTDVEEAKQNP